MAGRIESSGRGVRRWGMVAALFVFSSLVGYLIHSFVGAVDIPDRKDDFHLFVLAGQSNMVGRARSPKGDMRAPNPRVLALNHRGKWVVAKDPIHFDDGAGIGLGTSFGDSIAEARPEITVGLIPCAVGGSPIASWEPGAEFGSAGIFPFDSALHRMQKAEVLGTLKAILWHQGETDAVSDATANVYEEGLRRLIGRFRDAAGDPDLPFLIGELGPYLRPVPEAPEALQVVRDAQRRVASADPNVILVPSEGLTDKGDGLHFDGRSLRELGRRFANVFSNEPGF